MGAERDGKVQLNMCAEKYVVKDAQVCEQRMGTVCIRSRLKVGETDINQE